MPRRRWFLGLMLVAACASAGEDPPFDDDPGDDDDPGADGGVPDASEPDEVDAAEPIVDAMAPPIDAASLPDAALPPIDAAPVPDAMLPPVDAAPLPDAMPPPVDAAPLPDGMPGGVCEEAALQPKNDTCAQAIDLTAAAKQPGGATIHGNTTGYVNQVPEAPTSCTDSFNEDGADAIYKVNLPGGKTLTASVTPLGWDASIYIVQNTCANSQPCVAGADKKGTGGIETATFVAGANMGGTYYIYVDSFNPPSSGTNHYGCFTLKVAIQ